MHLTTLLLQAAPTSIPSIEPPPLPPAPPWTFMDYAELTVGVFLFIWLLSILIRPKVALKNWYHFFPDTQFSAEDVYKRIINETKVRELHDLSISRAKYFESGIFSARREYLSIDYKTFTLDVGCAAFGKGYYISWWLGAVDPGFLSRIPILRDLLGKNPNFPSYYQLDTATLFESGVHDAILKVIDDISNEKGIRLLSESERKPNFESVIFQNKK